MTATSGEPPPILQERDPRTLWILGIGGVALLLLLATQALDVLLLLVLCGIAFLLERTAGDWLADVIGPAGSKILFVGGVTVATFILLSFGSVRDLLWRGLAKADEAGFHTVLIDHLNEMPAAGPIPGDGASNNVPRNTGRPGSPSSGGGSGSSSPSSSSPSSSSTSSSDSRASRSSEGRQPVASTRSVLRLGGQGGSVHFSVDVMASGTTVDEGTVEFSIDGRRVGSASVSNGRAEMRVGGVSSGPHRASARFLGTGRFGESVAESAFSR